MPTFTPWLTRVAPLLFSVVACSTEASLAPDSSVDGNPPPSDGGSTPTTDATLPTDGAAPRTDAGQTTDGGSVSTGPNKPNCKYQAHKTGLTTLQQAGGLSFSVYAPSNYDPQVGHTVVVLMHGQDSNGVPELNALWKPIADQEQLVLVAPKGSRPSTNGDATVGNWATADLNRVLALMTEVDDCYDVFPKKHILWGFSAGTFYGYLLSLIHISEPTRPY